MTDELGRLFPVLFLSHDARGVFMGTHYKVKKCSTYCSQASPPKKMLNTVEGLCFANPLGHHVQLRDSRPECPGIPTRTQTISLQSTGATIIPDKTGQNIPFSAPGANYENAFRTFANYEDAVRTFPPHEKEDAIRYCARRKCAGVFGQWSTIAWTEI